MLNRIHTTGELVVARLLQHGWVSSVIAVATKPEKVIDNARGTEWNLSHDEVQFLEKIEHHDRYRPTGKQRI